MTTAEDRTAGAFARRYNAAFFAAFGLLHVAAGGLVLALAAAGRVLPLYLLYALPLGLLALALVAANRITGARGPDARASWRALGLDPAACVLAYCAAGAAAVALIDRCAGGGIDDETCVAAGFAVMGVLVWAGGGAARLMVWKFARGSAS